MIQKFRISQVYKLVNDSQVYNFTSSEFHKFTSVCKIVTWLMACLDIGGLHQESELSLKTVFNSGFSSRKRFSGKTKKNLFLTETCFDFFSVSFGSHSVFVH